MICRFCQLRAETHARTRTRTRTHMHTRTRIRTRKPTHRPMPHAAAPPPLSALSLSHRVGLDFPWLCVGAHHRCNAWTQRPGLPSRPSSWSPCRAPAPSVRSVCRCAPSGVQAMPSHVMMTSVLWPPPFVLRSLTPVVHYCMRQIGCLSGRGGVAVFGNADRWLACGSHGKAPFPRCRVVTHRKHPRLCVHVSRW